MADDLLIGVRLKADGSGLVGEVRAGKAELDRLSQGMSNAGRRALEATRGTDRLARGMAAAGQEARQLALQQQRLAQSHLAGAGAMARFQGVMRSNRLLVQQFGFQIGDVATQLALGGNALLAFAIQGSQMLQFMGPFGAIAGAAVAILGALATGFFAAGDAADDLGDKGDEAADRLEKLTAVMRELQGEAEPTREALEATARNLAGQFAQDLGEVRRQLEALMALRRRTLGGLADFVKTGEVTGLEQAETQATAQALAARALAGEFGDRFSAPPGHAAAAVELVKDQNEKAQRERERFEESARDRRLKLAEQTRSLLLSFENESFRERQRAAEQAQRESERFEKAGLDRRLKLFEQSRALLLSFENDFFRERQRQADQAAKDHDAAVADIGQRLIALQSPYDQAIAAANRWRDEALAGLDATKAGYDGFVADVETIYNARLAEAYAQSLEDSREWSAGATRALRDYGDAATDAGANAERALSSSFRTSEDALVQFVTTGKAELAALQGVAENMAHALLRTFVTGPLANAGSDLFQRLLTSLFASGPGPGAGPPIRAHGGGLIGRDAFPVAAASAADFIGAPRFHAGGEVGVIAQRGEGIFTPHQMDNADRLFAALAQPLEVNVINNNGSAVSVQERRTPGGGRALEIQLDEAVAAAVRRPGSATHDALGATFGALPALKSR